MFWIGQTKSEKIVKSEKSGSAEKRQGGKKEKGRKRPGVLPRLWKRTLVFLGLAFAVNAGVSAAHGRALQRGIAEEVLRFHILANSDSEADQQVKEKVRDAILLWMQEQSQETAQTDREAAEAFLLAHLEEIEAVADETLQKQGVSYHAKAALEDCYFPVRTYGACTFPAGWYRALRICLGEAQGHNWWCILYPNLCVSDCLEAVWPSEEETSEEETSEEEASEEKTSEEETSGKESVEELTEETAEEQNQKKLKQILTAEEYESLLRQPSKWQLAFRWF